MKINMDIFEKEHIGSAIATVCFTIMFIFFLCGAPISKAGMFCIFIGAIAGNLNAWVAEYRNNK